MPDEIRFLKVFEFTAKDALLSAKLESELEKDGKAVNRFDAMIASICINRNAEIATFNVKHFKRFTKFGLKVIQNRLIEVMMQNIYTIIVELL